MYFSMFVIVFTLLVAASAQSTTITGTDSCVVPTTGPSDPPDPSMTWPTYITSGPAHPSNTVSGSAGGATPTCFHAADPDGAQGLCPDVSDSGWCECNDGQDYPILSSGTDPCAYTTLPATPTTLQSTDCSSSAVSITRAPASTTICEVPAGCTNEAAPPGCAVACT